MEILAPTRTALLKEQTLNWSTVQTPVIGQRLYHALRGFTRLPASTPWMLRRAETLAAIIEGVEPVIFPHELIVGWNYYGSDEGHFQEINLAPRREGESDRLTNYLKQGQLSAEQMDEVCAMLEIAGALSQHAPYTAEQPPAVAQAISEGIIMAYGTPENHTVIGFEQVVRRGFAALREEIDTRLAALDYADPAAPGRLLLLQSTRRVADAASTLGRRYAAAARALLAGCTDPDRRRDLQQIVAVTSQAPELPARTFHEAVQSLWFAVIINTWEDGINANSLGRIDQILYPYYAADLAAGRITEAEARELIACLWLKLYRDYDVQQVTLGGMDACGADAANPLTTLMLEVTGELDLIRCLGVRLHRASSPAFIRAALDVVRLGKGIPFFFNDDVIVPALAASGIALEDARDYANIGCIETTIPGKANPHAVSNRVNLLKCLELALNNGVSFISGEQIGPQTGAPEAMTALADLQDAYAKQVAHFTTLACFESNRLEAAYALTRPMPYKSLLTTGCLDNGRDFNAYGAQYNFHETMAMGLPNVADSLAALDAVVFANPRHTLRHVVDALQANFPQEALRQELLNTAPKYGNDDETVDRLAVWAFNQFCDVLAAQRSLSGLGYFAQPFTFLWHVDMGAQTGASADGRRQGEVFAYSLSPMQGRDRAGLTAVLNSLSRLPHQRAAGSTSAIIELDPVLCEEENMPFLVNFLQTAILQGVGQIQFNVVTVETLRRAQREPEKYRNLAVRVSGFSQRFCLLSPELQEHIIARTKHTH